MYKDKCCPICGDIFSPKSAKQKYCKKPIELKCPVCGDTYLGECQPDNLTTCSKPECKRNAFIVSTLRSVRKCRVCGSEFHPKSSRQLDCNKETIRTCIICGNDFIARCSINDTSRTCSVECMNELALIERQNSYANNHEAKCVLCGKIFHPLTNTQKICSDTHFSECVICGKEFELSTNSAARIEERYRKTCSKQCADKLRFIQGNPFSKPELREKSKQTMMKKYGVYHPMHSEQIKSKIHATYFSRTGYTHPSHNPLTRQGKNYRHSNLEKYVETVLTNNQVDYINEYLISKDNISHSFDFYLPKYNIYVDADGDYYHGYLDDSNGYQVSEDRDDIRTYLIPKDAYYFVIIESDKLKGINELLSMINALDNNAFNYHDHMFSWCRSIEFPYPQYQESRLRKDYANLIKLELSDYNSYCKLGISTIRHFHKSIYHAHVGSSKSLYDAWYDDDILNKVIDNRMLYVNNVDPSKILSGFYISKIVPKVSIFNPVLAKYLVNKYLNKYSQVDDPFSGYSGRLLGVTSANKSYVGRDINKDAIRESNEIIKFHNLNSEIKEENILDALVRNVECVLTCTPYYKKETYSEEQEYRSCDDWIDIVLQKYQAERYVFVVDNVEKYANNIKETILTRSHFGDSKEYVVVIDK